MKKHKLNARQWMKEYWRPLMAAQYFVVCLWDFILGPIATMVYFAYTGGDYVPWKPLTLEGGGLYHVAMGSICTMAAWGRTQEQKEKLKNFVKQRSDEDDDPDNDNGFVEAKKPKNVSDATESTNVNVKVEKSSRAD